MKQNSKSQAFFSDFAISAFILVVFIIIYFDYTKNLSDRDNSSLDELLAGAKIISSSLTTGGYPDNWKAGTVVRIGFTDEGNKINNAKFNEFNLINYNRSKKLLSTTKDYFFFFQNETGNLTSVEGFCGSGYPGVNVSYNIKSAYYYRGPGQEEYLKSFMQDKFDADIYQEGGSGNDLNALIANINNYGIVVMESPELSTNVFNDFKAAAEPYVNNGGFLINGGQLLAAQGKTMTGVTFQKIAGTSSSDKVATVVREDALLTFHVTDQIQFTQAYYIQNVPGAVDFTDIARFNESDINFQDILDNKIAMARWSYGYGKVIFFSDFDATYFKGDFQDNLKASIRRWIGATCLPIDISNIKRNNLVRIGRLLVYNSGIVKMVLYVWN